MCAKWLTDLLVFVVLVIEWEAVLCLALYVHVCRSGMLPSSFIRGSCAVGRVERKNRPNRCRSRAGCLSPAAHAFKVESYSLEMTLIGSWIQPNTFQPCLALGMNHNLLLQNRFKIKGGHFKKSEGDEVK